MGKTYRIKLKIKPKEKPTAFILDMNGLSTPLLSKAKLILVDRNIISNIKTIYDRKNHNDNKSNEYWLNFLDSPCYFLNAALCASEGVHKKTPTYEQFSDELKKANEILKKNFPKANIITHENTACKAAYYLTKDIYKNYNKDVAFLKEVSPLIFQRYPEHKLIEIESKIISIGIKHGLKWLGFPLIACLSCLYEGNKNKSIGKEVLKPKKEYTDQMAHNALMDLYSLTFLIQSNIKIVNKIGLCTADKGLSKFWDAIEINDNADTFSEEFKFSVTFKAAMFERLNTEELSAFEERLTATFG